MRLFSKVPDGGANSGVTGYFLIELKSLFSIVLLHFAKGSREAYHSHAFNAITLWLKGRVFEYHLGGKVDIWYPGDLKLTRRDIFHKIIPWSSTWALSFRGPWVDTWQESRKGKIVNLTHGRKVL